MEREEEIKLVIIGNGTVGKSHLCMTHYLGRYQEPLPVLCTGDDGLQSIVQGVRFMICDTKDDGDRYSNYLRLAYYATVDGLLLCFSVDNRSSFEDIKTKWHPEVSKHCPGVPFILVGTKIDLRENSQEEANKTFVSNIEGTKMAEEIKAEKYLECSAKEVKGLTEVFEEAVKAAMKPRPIIKKRPKRSHCTLL